MFFFEVTDTYGGASNYGWVRRYTVNAKSFTGALTMVNREEGYHKPRKVMDTGDFCRWDIPGCAICIMGTWMEDSDPPQGKLLGCSYYETVVGNVGTVYRGYEFKQALAAYRAGRQGIGRAEGEPVTIMKDGEPMSGYDYVPPKKVPSVAFLKATYAPSHPEHSILDWRDCVAYGDTLQGYWDWVRYQLMGDSE
jgi:hypothetical protein